MGRFVVVDDGDFEWEWKFWFARQCSNFGFILEMVAGDGVHVSREYVEHDGGEYVVLKADREKLLEKLKSLKIDGCPICGDSDLSLIHI